ncbi:MAG: hydroxymethylglutaryl-CoA synthase [Holosporales bacterium]|jgi:hydroxymethylglutaryl-CoA synthase|nr:hydroxymethylglutaryl-CoA synthase [Holosporales bacterium]
MNTVGIDVLTFSTGHYVLNLTDLAAARGVDPQKYTIGLGQDLMSVPSPQEDIITMGVEAGLRVLEKIPDKNSIRLVLFATESSIDQSKSAGIYAHHFLGLSSACRVVELKQACYSATVALQMAAAVVRQNPKDKALIIASDVARYGLKTSGEPTQGCGAVAFVVSSNPRLFALENVVGLYTHHIMDFWRPNGQDTACVNGRYSTVAYLEALEKAWIDFRYNGGVSLEEIAFTCYHTPFTKMAEKAFTRHVKVAELKRNTEAHTFLKPALLYGRQLGNSYTSSLYMSLLSLLETTSQGFSGARLGFFSYGSGCVAEFFTGIVSPRYKDVLFPQEHASALAQRALLTVPEYEAFYVQACSSAFTQEACYKTGPLCFLGVKDHQRQYGFTHSTT